MILCTAFIGQFISKTGKYKKMAIGGLLIMTFGMVLLHFMTPDTAIYITIIYMCIVGLGLGISMPVFSLTIQNAVEPQQLGVATASSQLFRSLGGTIGIAVMGTVMNSHMTSKMTELGAASGAAGGQMQIDPKYAESLKEVMNPQTLLDQPKLESIISQLPPELQTMVDNLVHMVREALSYGVTSTFLTGAIVTAVAVILTFFLKENPLRSAKRCQGEARRPYRRSETASHCQFQILICASERTNRLIPLIRRLFAINPFHY